MNIRKNINVFILYGFCVDTKSVRFNVFNFHVVFSFKKEHGRCFHPNSLLRRSKSLSRPTLVVRFDNALLFTAPVIGYDAALGVPVAEKVRCTILFLCPLHYNAVTEILHELC